MNAIRIDDCKPRAITASSRIEIDRLLRTNLWLIPLNLLRTDQKSNRFNRKLGARIPFKSMMDYAMVYGSEETPCVPLHSNHPLYILYTSGTTGKPKEL
jgi:propionyl-CoA synthetase